jgi:hypothetical protein
MTGLIPILVAATLLVLGLSYLLQTERWLGLTRRFAARPEDFFPAAVVMVAAGVTIAYGYDRWTGTWPLFVTLLGWLLALEGAVILLLPGLIQRFQRLPDPFLRVYLRCGGILLVVLGGLLWRSLAVPL